METTKVINRRKFLQMTGAAIGVSALACCGGGVLATRTPRIDFPESSDGGTNAMHNILVTYASKAGSTGEIAEAIGQTLSEKGASVDVRPVKEVDDVSGYQAVVVGSAIRIGQWLSEATRFLEANQAVLKKVPIAYFSVCLRITEDKPEAQREAQGYNEAASAIVTSVSAKVFAGKMDYSQISLLERMMMKAMKSPEGDWRDWDAIHAWAGQLFI
ncbi:MAG TPA: flavodoxin [Chloroflexi bacterium]|nr:flavodoxin [Chloroflexota bacterium]